MRLFLPKEWTDDAKRRAAAQVPESVGYRPKWRIALDEIDCLRASGVRFGCVLADAGYGTGAEFRQGLSDRHLAWAVGISSTHTMHAEDVEVSPPQPSRGRRRPRGVPDSPPRSAARFLEKHGDFRRMSWRKGTKGRLSGEFAIVRVRPADGPETKDGLHLPGEPAWLVCERFRNGDRKFYLVGLDARASAKRIVSAIKARWSCEQMHQQRKEELGLDPFEGRSWLGLHPHAVLTRIAFAFLLHVRRTENKSAA